MKNSKASQKQIIVIIIGLILFIIAGVFLFKSISSSKDDKYVKSADENSITRYEWMEMLCEKAGLREYNNVPYFSDVNENNDYFPFVQAAVEWKILSDDSDFEGESIASGRFIALTAIKALGENKVKIYLGATDDIDDNDYLDLAVENNLIEKSDFQVGLSREKCEWILEKLFNELYFGKFWKDDFSESIYLDGVIELAPEDVLQCNNDGTEIKIAPQIIHSVSAGSIIVFKNPNNDFKIAKRVLNIDTEGGLQLADAELEQVIESIVVSDIEQITFDDIVAYYGFNEDAEIKNARSMASDWNVINTGFHEGRYEGEGFKLSLSTEEEEGKNKLGIEITDNHSGISYSLPIDKEVALESDYFVEINFDKIIVAAQIMEHFLIDVKYAEVAVDVHATFEGEVKGEGEEKILLYETMIPLADGIAGVKLELYFVISAEGNISLAAEMPMQACVQYDKETGFRNLKQDVSVRNPEIKLNCEVNTMLRFEPTAFLLGIFNIIDIEADIGAVAEAETVLHPNSQECLDISIGYPVVKISVCKDDDKKSIAEVFFGSMEWEIISSKDASHQIGLHYEYLPDGLEQFVDKCTYMESADGKDILNNQADDILNNTYSTKYNNANMEWTPVYSFDYPDNWSVISETYEQANDICPILDTFAQEVVVLTNERGVTVSFIRIDKNVFSLGGRGALFMEYTASEVEDNTFFNGTAVTKIQPVNEGFKGTEIYDSIDDGNVSYALIYWRNDNLFASGEIGFYEMIDIGIDYDTAYNFFSESPDGRFTEKEEKEVIAILASFRSGV